MLRHKLFLFSSLLFIAFLSCNKEGTFLGNKDFTSDVSLVAYTSSPNAYVKVELGDTVIKKLPLNESTSLGEVLHYTTKYPASGEMKLRIWWKNTSQLIADTTVSLNSRNEFYLVQLDPTRPHTFYTSFGGSAETAPDNEHIKARFIYIRDTAAPVGYGDTIRIKFTTLYQDQSGSYSIPSLSDTAAVTVINGQVSSYITLPDSKVPVDGGNNTRFDVFLGYQIINPKTGAILKDFCYDPAEVGIVDYRSDEGGKFQTVRMGYNESGQTCPYGQYKPTYEPQILFGDN